MKSRKCTTLKKMMSDYQRHLKILTAGIMISSLSYSQPVLVKDINEGIGGSNPYCLSAVNGILFFAATDNDGSIKLFKSDGTENGTELVKDWYPDNGGVNPEIFASPFAYKDKLLFQAETQVEGQELWISDGTEAGTYMLKELNPELKNNDPASPRNGVFPGFKLYNGFLYFKGSNTAGNWELWRTDGTAEGTVQVKEIFDGFDGSDAVIGSDPRNFVIFKDTLFFRAKQGKDPYHLELFKSDGVINGYTVLVKEINPNERSEPMNLIAGENGVFFSADDGTNGRELWMTDGSESGTIMVKDINAGGESSYPTEMASAGPVVFFGANDGTHGLELWKSDGTAEGTVKVKEINATGDAGYFGQIIEYQGKVYFAADDGSNGSELWTSDGTEAGTVMVKDINQDAQTGSYPGNLFIYNDKLYFSADDGSNGNELWRTDGTDAGTEIVADINKSGDSYPQNFTICDGVLFFTADDGENGTELWSYYSESSATGLNLIKDTHLTIYPNPFIDKITVGVSEYEEVGEVTIFDCTGRVITHKRTDENNLEFDLKNLTEGLYLIRVKIQDKDIVQKIIKY